MLGRRVIQKVYSAYLLFNTLRQADLVFAFTAPALPSVQCRYPRNFAAAALGVMMSATSAGAAETPPPPLCGQERKIQCYCGECSVVVTGDPLGASYCHCSRCRTLSGAPFMGCVLFDPKKVAVSGETSDIKTSPQVSRKRCKKCGSPIYASMGKRLAVLPLFMFGRSDASGEKWMPQHHMYYDDRVMDIQDDLPKYKGSSRTSELWTPS